MFIQGATPVFLGVLKSFIHGNETGVHVHAAALDVCSVAKNSCTCLQCIKHVYYTLFLISTDYIYMYLSTYKPLILYSMCSSVSLKGGKRGTSFPFHATHFHWYCSLYLLVHLNSTGCRSVLLTFTVVINGYTYIHVCTAIIT